MAAQTLWKENRVLSGKNSIAENDAGQRPGRSSACRVRAPERGSACTRFRVPTLSAHFIVRSGFYNFCRLSGGAKMGQAQPRKVETIFGIQKGSCRTLTQSAPKTHACLYRFVVSNQGRIRKPLGPQPTRGALGLGYSRGSGSASGEGAFRGGARSARVSAPRRGQVRDTLYPLERQVAASAAPPREARPGGNALRVLRLHPSCPGTR